MKRLVMVLMLVFANRALADAPTSLPVAPAVPAARTVHPLKYVLLVSSAVVASSSLVFFAMDSKPSCVTVPGGECPYLSDTAKWGYVALGGAGLLLAASIAMFAIDGETHDVPAVSVVVGRGGGAVAWTTKF